MVGNDQNRDGRQEPSELVAGDGGAPTGSATVVVTLYAATTNTVVATTTTDSGAYYQFTGLLPGSYYLHFDLPPDYQATQANGPTADDVWTVIPTRRRLTPL